MTTVKTPWRSRIKVRVLVFGIVMSILPVLFISLATFTTVSHMLKENIREQNLQRATAIAGQLQDSIENIAKNLINLTLVKSPSLISDQLTEQQRLFNIILRQEPYIEEIALIDQNLNVLSQASRREVLPEPRGSYLNYIDPTVIDRGYDVSGVFFSKDRRPQFYITVGIQDPQTREHLGYLQAKADLREMVTQYINTRIGVAGYVFFVDDKGFLIGHTDFSQVLRREDVSENAAVRSFLDDRQVPEDYLSRNGEEVLGQYARVNKPNWGVVIEQPVREAYEPIYALAKNWGLILFFTGSGVTMLSIFFGLKLVRPIEDLERQVKKIHLTGELQTDLSHITNDEIGRLAISFKQLMAMLDEKNQSIKAEQELLRTVVDGIGAGMALLNDKRQVIWWNPIFAGWFGDRNYLGIAYEEVIKGLEDIDTLLLEYGRVNSFDVNGERKYLRQMYYEIPATNSEGAAYLVVLEDVTGQVEMETRMIETDKMAAVGLLASGIAHEINNPLAIVSAHNEELLDRLQEPEEVDKTEIGESLRITLEQIARCKIITDRLLHFSRKRSQEYDLLDLGVASSRIIELIKPKAKQKNISLEQQLEPGFYVLGNENEWQQVALNILANALDASPENSRITIDCTRNGDRICFRVNDQGQGISQRELKNVFNPFFTTKPVGKGTGLGLFVSYGIVQRMNGQLRIESTEGKGTTVIITLPVYEVN